VEGQDLNAIHRDRQSSKNAWGCVFALIITYFLLVLVLREAARSVDFRQWLQTLPGRYFLVIIQASVFLGIPFYFSRAKTVGAFWQQVGCGSRINIFGWVAACIAIFIALIDGYGTRHGWTAASRGYSYPISDLSGNEWFFYALKTVVIVPFYVEVAMRGVLYDSFRKSYGVPISIGIVICVSVCFHWLAMSASFYTSGCFGLLWVLLCVVKERTGSLWNCWLCNAVFSACGIKLLWPTVCIMILISIQLIRISRRGRAASSK
jgi:hypothetical protein